MAYHGQHRPMICPNFSLSFIARHKPLTRQGGVNFWLRQASLMMAYMKKIWLAVIGQKQPLKQGY